ncbi:hypothetical protein Desku_0952 [Desulfofundulus kuznetsovii DSM 6115]|uniref:Uncharacterized protein n=1 Tax=Desulfofundulus kuznetsovii (strain DSM 6115 / VKM B-1805 / 17) TaxID=760568 RepID=A0AAU8Q1G7_DESK7|nr:hypothetical protein Desku_0952 [Desulfofundulus kuznetsovii DSM 6115]
MKKTKKKKGTENYSVKVIFTGTEEESRKVLAEARQYAFAKILEKIRRERGEYTC